MCEEWDTVYVMLPPPLPLPSLPLSFLPFSLRASSVINGITYLPWNDADLSELRVVSPIASNFNDPNGLPLLSTKQRDSFECWMRPEDICQLPTMVHLISSFTIKQTLIGDCSFLASLAVCADYERRFKTRLVTRWATVSVYSE